MMGRHAAANKRATQSLIEGLRVCEGAKCDDGGGGRGPLSEGTAQGVVKGGVGGAQALHRKLGQAVRRHETQSLAGSSQRHRAELAGRGRGGADLIGSGSRRTSTAAPVQEGGPDGRALPLAQGQRQAGLHPLVHSCRRCHPASCRHYRCRHCRCLGGIAACRLLHRAPLPLWQSPGLGPRG